MINKRLISTIPGAKEHIIKNVVLQWIGLLCNVVLVFTLANFLQNTYQKTLTENTVLISLALAAAMILVRLFCTLLSHKESYASGKDVKGTLREKIYTKWMELGGKGGENTSSLVQVASEGVDQLEIYFGKYLPQFFYSLLAPLTLFAILSFLSIKAAGILLLCVPLIPVSIVMIQKYAKKILAKYWDSYTNMGDSFLENLQGLTTLKIYGADGQKHKEMNAQAENFRKITMKVLTMQLNSVTIMDLVAYGGAALGTLIAALEFLNGNISLAACIAIILLAADFFIPLRLLGSFFHIAMNGMAASDKMFALLDQPAPPTGNKKDCIPNPRIEIEHLSYVYDEVRVLNDITLSIENGSFVSIVGESGSGKSTLAGVLTQTNRDYRGEVLLGGTAPFQYDRSYYHKKVTKVTHQAYLFSGTVRENLLMAKGDAADDNLWNAIEQVRLDEFLREEEGLDTRLLEGASNLSGGQRQRLAIARALLRDSEIYIFDEATSNIDADSENDIIAIIHELAKTKTVILISHRLANVVPSDCIYVLDKGNLIESGTHGMLLAKGGKYSDLYQKQLSLEQRGKESRYA